MTAHGGSPPKLSIILLDWSCRESYHSLDYLNTQTVDRGRYEIIWIEFYGRRPSAIQDKLNHQYEPHSKHPVIDKWIVLDMPETIYYHKHLMYNIGIIASSAEIVVFCDSDAVFSQTFVQRIIKAFEGDRNIVLHIDEVRNIDKRHYPFNYPAIEEILGQGCINWREGKTTGVLHSDDILHNRNYGACMCALREDMINIGGADEHIDYLGHVCGPYEMTFRLVNAGKTEVWHEEEFIYHVWHPGTDGNANYMGPHDGKNFSTTALDIIRTKRVLPLVENISINKLRLNNGSIESHDELMMAALTNTAQWEVEKMRIRRRSQQRRILDHIKNSHAITLLHILLGQVVSKIKHARNSGNLVEYLIGKTYKMPQILSNLFLYNSYVYERCSNIMKEIESRNIKEIAICGTGDEARVFRKMIGSKFKIVATYDLNDNKRPHNVYPIEEYISCGVPLVVTDLKDISEILRVLKKMGIPEGEVIL